MMSVDQARTELARRLGESRTALHSETVASRLRQLAVTRGQDADLWQIVGLCHDLDDEVTIHDRALHGVITCRWLEGRLPSEALEAIRADDHRTGLRSNTELADALRLADALAIACEDVGRDICLGIGSDSGWQQLSDRLKTTRPYLCPIIAELSSRMNLHRTDLALLFAQLTPRR